jgi:hypothetical protein
VETRFPKVSQLPQLTAELALAERLSEAITQLAGVNLIGTTDTEGVAIAVAIKEDVDVTVLDLHLKQGTGFGVMRALATLQRKPTVLTNFGLPEYKKRLPMQYSVAGGPIRRDGDDAVGECRASRGACCRLRNHQCGSGLDDSGQISEELGRDIEGGEQCRGGYGVLLLP